MATKFIILAALVIGIYTAGTWAVVFFRILGGHAFYEPDKGIAGQELAMAIGFTMLSIAGLVLQIRKTIIGKR